MNEKKTLCSKLVAISKKPFIWKTASLCVKRRKEKINRHVINERHALCVTNDKETSNWLKSRRKEIKKRTNELTKCTERKNEEKKLQSSGRRVARSRQCEFWNARKWNNNWLLTAQSHFVAPLRGAVASSHFRWWRALLRLGEIDQAYRPFFCVTTATAPNNNWIFPFKFAIFFDYFSFISFFFYLRVYTSRCLEISINNFFVKQKKTWIPLLRTKTNILADNYESYAHNFFMMLFCHLFLCVTIFHYEPMWIASASGCSSICCACHSFDLCIFCTIWYFSLIYPKNCALNTFLLLLVG